MAFIDLAQVDIVEEVSENAKMLVEDGGEVVRTALPSVTTKLSELEMDVDLVASPSVAEVGQVISVKAVDENGKPTEWECVDMSSGDSSYFIEWNNGYAVNEEVYNAFVNYFANPTVGFPDVTTLNANNYGKIISVHLVSVEGGNYSSLNGIRCAVAPSNDYTFVIAPTSDDASNIESQDMA